MPLLTALLLSAVFFFAGLDVFLGLGAVADAVGFVEAVVCVPFAPLVFPPASLSTVGFVAVLSVGDVFSAVVLDEVLATVVFLSAIFLSVSFLTAAFLGVGFAGVGFFAPGLALGLALGF